MRIFNGFMKGVNLGGWLSQYDEASKEHFDSFITEEDIRRIARMGFDHVRLPVDYTVLEEEDGTVKESGYSYLERCMEWTKRERLNILIDLHKTYGYSFDPLDKEMDRERFFRDAALQERFFRLWETIAGRCRENGSRIAYELLNEIVSPDVAEEWNDIAGEAVRRIRKAAPEAYIVIGGVRYNNVTSVPMLRKPADDRIVYNFHCYEPIVFTHQKAYWVEQMPKDRTVNYPGSLEEYRSLTIGLPPELTQAIMQDGIPGIGEAFFDTLFAPAAEAARENNVPLYCGEYGVIDQAPAEAALLWHKDINAVFEKYGIGRALWTYRGKDFGLMDSHYDEVREELINYL